MSSALDLLDPRLAKSPVIFRPAEKALLIPSQPMAVLITPPSTLLNPSVKQNPVSIPNHLTLGNLLNSAKEPVSAAAVYEFFSSKTAKGAELKALWQLIKQGSLVVYRWPYTVPKRKTRPLHGTWNGNGNYTPPAQLTLAQLDELAKTAEELDELQGIVPVEQAPEEPTHQVELSYTQVDGSPVADKPYTVKVDGTVVATGTLDANGKATVSGIPEGTAEVEYLDDVDADIAATRAELKAELDAILAAHIAESAQENAEFDEKSLGGKVTQLASDAGDGFLAATDAVNESIIEAATLAKRPEIAIWLQAGSGIFKKAVSGELSLEACKDEFKNAYSDFMNGQEAIDEAISYYMGFNPEEPEHVQAMADAIELAMFIAQDSETQAMLLEFGAQYIANNSVSDWAFLSGGVALEIIIGLLTGGATTARAATKLKDIVDLLKLKRTNRTNSGPTNSSLDDQADLPDEPELTLNNNAETSDETSSDSGTTKNGEEAPETSKTDTSGEPISMVTGEELLTLTDFTLPGPLPLTWTRTYRTSNPDDSGIGHGWTHTLSEYLIIKDQIVELHDREGRVIKLPRPTREHLKTHNIVEQLTAVYLSDDALLVVPYGNPNGITKRFASVGGEPNQLKLVSVQDNHQNGYELNYQHGQLTSVVASHGEQLHFDYSACGRISSIKRLPIGTNNSVARGESHALINYFYHHGDLAQAQDPTGAYESYRYTNHVIIRRQLKSGYRFYFHWDEYTTKGKCLRQWGDLIDGKPTYDYHFSWNTAKREVTATDTRGGKETYRYNDNTKLIYHRDAEGGESHFHYDDNGLLVSARKPGGSELYRYNAYGQRIEITNTRGQQTKLEYDQDGRVIAVVDHDGNRWARAYNSRGQLAAITNPLGHSTQYRYNNLGLISAVINPLGQTTTYLWNHHGQLTAVKNAQGQSQTYRYDHKQRLMTVRSGELTTHYQYNARDQISAVIRPGQQTTRYTYTALGLVETITDPAGRKTQFEYDGLSQVTRRINPDGTSLAYEYDGERNLVGLINENGERYQLDYDLNERLTQEIGFDGRVTQYQYNRAGFLTEQREKANLNADGTNTTYFQRDAQGRLTSKTNADGTTHFGYNSQGQLTSANNAARNLAWAYNANGQLLEEHQDEFVIRHAYNAAGLRTQTLLPDGTKIKLNYNRAGQFTAMRRLAPEADNFGEVIAHIQHDQLGRETALDHGNSLKTLSEYDPQGRLSRKGVVQIDLSNPIKDLISSTLNGQEKQTELRHKTYGYNNAGLLSQINDSQHGTTNYFYDPLERLTQVDGPNPEHLIHDPASNILANAESEQSAKEQAQNTKVASNRLQFQGDSHFEYDEFGNRTETRRGKEQKLVTEYKYNASHQLISVKNNAGATHYEYDALGRRTKKRHIAQDGTATQTDFLWQGDVLLEERTHSAHGKEQSKQTYLFKPNSFQPLALVKNNQVYRFHLDHLGTPEAVSNAQGQTIWAASFKSYGNLALKQVDSGEITQPIRFQGQYFDEETGLHYNRFRYYDPNTGSFLTADPIKLLGGTNNYQYVPNPVGWVDPLGLKCEEGYIPDFDEYDTGQGFSGAYDPITETIIMLPSKTGDIDQLPPGFVPRQGGHHFLREIMRDDGFDVSELRGFSATLNGDGTFNLQFISGQLNLDYHPSPGSDPRELPIAERPAIENAFESLTGRAIRNKTAN